MKELMKTPALMPKYIDLAFKASIFLRFDIKEGIGLKTHLEML